MISISICCPISSSAGTKEFQEGNCFWNSYVLDIEHDTIDEECDSYSATIPNSLDDNGRTHYMVSPPALLLSMLYRSV